MAPNPQKKLTVKSDQLIPSAAVLTFAFLAAPMSSAATIAGSDFSNAAIFNAPDGSYNTLTDDLNLSDGITVGSWTAIGGGMVSKVMMVTHRMVVTRSPRSMAEPAPLNQR